MIDAVRSYAPGFIFTTALPPAICAAATAAIRHLKTSSWERERHQDRAARVKAVLNAAGLPVMASETHIVPVLVGDPEKCKAASDLLLAEHGIYIQPINYPTVPRGMERLRITPSPYHDDALIDAPGRSAGRRVGTARPAQPRAARSGGVIPVIPGPAQRVRAKRGPIVTRPEPESEFHGKAVRIAPGFRARTLARAPRNDKLGSHLASPPSDCDDLPLAKQKGRACRQPTAKSF